LRVNRRPRIALHVRHRYTSTSAYGSASSAAAASAAEVDLMLLEHLDGGWFVGRDLGNAGVGGNVHDDSFVRLAVARCLMPTVAAVGATRLCASANAAHSKGASVGDAKV
jgi:hypothetical protein